MVTGIRRSTLAALIILPMAAFAAPADIQIRYEPKGEDAKRVEQLVGTIQSKGLSAKHLVDAANARPFLHLAATHDDTAVVGAALGALGRTWSRTGKGKRPKVDDDYRKVVLARLKAGEGKVVAGALKAARLLLGGKPHGPTLDQVLALARSGPPATRVAAINALINVRDFQLPEKRKGDVKQKVVTVVAQNLGAKEPHVLATALHQLAKAGFPGMPGQAELMTRAKALMAHANPGVQGEAMLLAARIAANGDRAALGPLLVKGLKSKNAYVRAAAAEALGTVQYQKAVPELVRLLDDGAKNAYAVDGFTALDGGKGRVRLRPSGRRVDESALEALALMTKGSKKPFDPGSLHGRKRAKQRAAAIAAAKKRFGAKNK